MMKLTKEQIQRDIDALPAHYKTGDVDRLIRYLVKEKADVSALRPCCPASAADER